MTELNTFNKYMVGVQGDSIVIINPPRGPMQKTDALVLAAWIVVLSECCTVTLEELTFDEILQKLKEGS